MQGSSEPMTAGARYDRATGFSWMSEYLSIPEKLYSASILWAVQDRALSPTFDELRQDGPVAVVSDGIAVWA